MTRHSSGASPLVTEHIKTEPRRCERSCVWAGRGWRGTDPGTANKIERP